MKSLLTLMLLAAALTACSSTGNAHKRADAAAASDDAAASPEDASAAEADAPATEGDSGGGPADAEEPPDADRDTFGAPDGEEPPLDAGDDVDEPDVCSPDCGNRDCGPDGCGGVCGACGEGAECTNGVCLAVCAPDCDGKACGPNGCEGLCGECPSGQECQSDGACHPLCTPDCDGKVCGPDGCGHTCGSCGGGQTCSAGQCEGVCTPSCNGMTCGDDGCGGICGKCPVGDVCQDGSCAPECAPACSGKVCGGDGCGGSCGSCGVSQVCNAGQCQAVCAPSCAGKACGGDGCGGSCGSCSAGLQCLSGQCGCAPKCTGKTCGDDGCGGSCGTCSAGKQCVLGTCKVPTGDTCGDAFLVDQVPYSDGRSTETTSMGQYAVPAGACPGYSGAIGDSALDIVYRFIAPGPGPYTFTLAGTFDTGLYIASSCANVGASCLGAADLNCTGCAEKVDLTLAAGQEVMVFVDGSWHITQSGNYVLSIDKGCDPTCTGWECGPDGCGGSCGTCAQGQVCASGQCETPQPSACQADSVINTLPYTHSQHLYWGTSNYSIGTCQGKSVNSGKGAEHMYALTAPKYGDYSFELVQPIGTQLMMNMYVVRDCTQTSATCLGRVISGTVRAILQPGETVYVFVDALGLNDSGDYTLNVDVCDPQCGAQTCGMDSTCGISCGACPAGQACGPNGTCGAASAGDTCATAFTVNQVPATGVGSLKGATDKLSFKDCPYSSPSTYGAGLPDQVWTFTAPATDRYKVTLDTQNGTKALLNMLKTCTSPLTTCEAWGNGCALQAVSCPSAITVDLVAGETRTFVVDGSAASEVGDYQLRFEQACPDSCLDRECGPDACLGSCGSCPQGLACSAAGQCEDAAILVINEVDYDTPGVDDAEFVEIKNVGKLPATLANYTLQSINGTGGALLKAITLSEAGATLGAGEYLVVGQAGATSAVPAGVAKITVATTFLQNGGADGDAVRLLNDTAGTVDAVSYDNVVSSANEGGTATVADTATAALGRCPDGDDSNDNASDFVLLTPTPGKANACPP